LLRRSGVRSMIELKHGGRAISAGRGQRRRSS
jgi:hypothetical protein